MSQSQSTQPIQTTQFSTDYDIVIYHKNCPDGIAAAWVYWNTYKDKVIDPDVIYHEMVAGKYSLDSDYLNITNKKVLMMDVCPNKEEIKEILSKVKHLTILDHHKSAERDIEELKTVGLPSERQNVIFDMKRSGCQIAWDFFNKDTVRPWFIEIIADRDLWKWELPDSKELGSYMYNFNFYKSKEALEKLTSFTKIEIDSAREIGKVLIQIEQDRVLAIMKT